MWACQLCQSSAERSWKRLMLPSEQPGHGCLQPSRRQNKPSRRCVQTRSGSASAEALPSQSSPAILATRSAIPTLRHAISVANQPQKCHPIVPPPLLPFHPNQRSTHCSQENQLPAPPRTRAAHGRRAKRGLGLALETVTEEEEPSAQAAVASGALADASDADRGARPPAIHCCDKQQMRLLPLHLLKRCVEARAPESMHLCQYWNYLSCSLTGQCRQVIMITL